MTPSKAFNIAEKACTSEPYISFHDKWVKLEGSFTSSELRIIAELMDMIEKSNT